MTFVFGHTHKPYEARLDVKGVGPVDVYNSGGWVVDTVDPHPKHGGAIVVGDDALRFASIRLYAELDAAPPRVARIPGAPASPLTDALEALVGGEAFLAVPGVAQRAVQFRQEQLRLRLAELR